VVRIELTTEIAAPRERCFDLARSIDLHLLSTQGTGEKAVAGVTSGLIGLGQDVTWQGRHLGFRITHQSRITQYRRPDHFQDRMVNGRFRYFCHDHHFEQTGPENTRMRDFLEFEAPMGFLGRIVEKTVLRAHLRGLLERRNECIKRVAESDDWKRYAH
jgi:ligand-binding SRPBCC domain-containing protein